MPRDNFKSKTDKDRAKRVLGKSEQTDEETRREHLNFLDKLTTDEKLDTDRRKRGNEQLIRFKKEGERFERAYTGIMLDGPASFDTFSHFFTDGGLQPGDIRCEIGQPFDGCKNLQQVRNRLSGEGSKPAVKITRGKHEFEWKVFLSQAQMDTLKESYLGKAKGEGQSPG